MSKSQVLGIVGGILLIAGVFAPVVQLPVFGNLTFFDAGRRLAYVLIAAGALGFLLAAFRQAKWMWFPGLVAIGMMVVLFFRLQSGAAKMIAGATAAANSSTAPGALDTSMHYQWGWAVLLVGGILLVAGAATNHDPE